MAKIVLYGIALALLCSCTHKTIKEEIPVPVEAVKTEMNSKPVTVYPNATAFRMSGDYANNVAITLSGDGNLLYYPAPTDITADSAPINLGDGWWLNCQGIGPHSVFTKYTFAEYSALPETPDRQQLKMSVIPGACETQFVELPYKLRDALGNIEEIKAYLKNQ